MPIEQWEYVAEPPADGWYPKVIAVTPCVEERPSTGIPVAGGGGAVDRLWCAGTTSRVSGGP